MSFDTPKRATAYIFFLSLPSKADSGNYQVDPTLAAGDVQVSKDGGALANISILPTVPVAGCSMVKVQLSGTEMTADNVTLLFKDVAGDEWGDVTVNIQTSVNILDDLSATALAILNRNLLGCAAGMVGAASTTTSVVTSSVSPVGAVADQFKDRVIVFDSTTTTTALRCQVAHITASSNAAAPVLTVSGLTTAPVSGDTFTIV